MHLLAAELAFVALALVVRKGLKLHDVLISPPVELNDDNCELVGNDHMVGSEDMALGKRGVLFITSGDLLMTFGSGSDSANPGGIFALDMRGSSDSVVRLTMEKFPAGVGFQPHGIYVSNSSDHLLTTSHAGSNSRLEVFRIEYHPSCLESQPWSCSPATLHHLNSITSNLFPNYGINDVVEGISPQELYVTQWLKAPLVHGLKSEAESALVPKVLSSWFKAWPQGDLMGVSWTRVYRCTWSEGILGGHCEPITDRQFYGSNGITISEDRKQLFINDPADKMITIMDRQDDGSLLETGHIDLPWMVDNIEMNGGEIVMGTIPDVGKVHPFGMKVVPGGMLVARKEEDGQWKVDQHHSLVHDGSKLSQISAAARWGGKVVLGSPFARGVLVCH